ncbi:MAG: methyltransferase domain-containing protein [Chitinispirillaceae bacterium]|nr:methyltransferase domain-containing protein [Chitinispirillaceae bacterium]
MVVDPTSNYTSPAGREYSRAAARMAGVNPASRVLDMGCGYGEAACTLAADFRCKVTAVDMNAENVEMGRRISLDKRVSHLITFEVADILTCDYAQTPFDLVLAEGGILSFIARPTGLRLANSWIPESGWLAFSDLVFISEKTPEEIRALFDDEMYHYETEASYRSLVDEAGFDVCCMCLVPPSGWDNYYAHMKRRVEEGAGFFADLKVRQAFKREIELFYQMEGFRYVGYLFCMARKR